MAQQPCIIFYLLAVVAIAENRQGQSLNQYSHSCLYRRRIMGRLRLTGRTAIVTGARGGLGAALANTLESMGVKVQRISRGDEWNPTNYELLFLNAGFGMLQSSAKSFHNV